MCDSYTPTEAVIYSDRIIAASFPLETMKLLGPYLGALLCQVIEVRPKAPKSFTRLDPTYSIRNLFMIIYEIPSVFDKHELEL